MTSTELYKAFLFERETRTGDISPIFSSTVAHYLNLAQEQIVREMAPVSRVESRTADELRVLYKQQKEVSVGNPGFGDSNHEYTVTSPDDLAYLLYMEAGITRSGNPSIPTKQYVPCVEISPSDVEFWRVSEHHRPFIQRPGVLRDENGFRVLVDHETQLEDVRINYIRYPELIELTPDGQTSELPDYLHNTLVTQAVTLFLNELQTVTNSGNEVAQ